MQVHVFAYSSGEKTRKSNHDNEKIQRLGDQFKDNVI